MTVAALTMEAEEASSHRRVARCRAAVREIAGVSLLGHDDGGGGCQPNNAIAVR